MSLCLGDYWFGEDAVTTEVRTVDKGSIHTERVLVILLCFAAGLRIFLFSAAFPFFNNVDEEAHLDFVLKIAEGHFPTGLEPFDKETIDLIMANRSPEYAQGIPAGDEFNRMVFQRKYWIDARNHEATSPPAYYLVAATWYKIGKILLSGRKLLYWIRFLNIPLFATLVWVAWRFGATAFPTAWHLRLAVPLMVAFWPQDVFYSLNADVLSPLFAGLGMLYVLQLCRQPDPDTFTCLITGLLFAASCLTKLTNVPLFAAALIVMAASVRWPAKPAALIPVCKVACAAMIPIIVWSARNVLTVGDFTATGLKIRQLGWSLKPFGQIWNHPIFTMHGLITFWHDLMGTFWRGEFFWHGHRLASPGVDMFYSISSAVFVGVGAASIIYLRRDARAGSSVMYFFFSVAMLAVLSIIFDFGSSPYPSSEYPYFTSGRLISGAILPFVALYVTGMNSVLRKLRIKDERACFSAIGAVVLIATISEIYLSWDVFCSPYNWFHL